MLVYGPGVTVSYTCSGAPPLVTVVEELGEIRAEEFEIEAEVSEIILASDCVQADEMAGEALAEPVADFRLDEPVFPFMAADAPGVKFGAGVERLTRGESDLHADIRAQEGVVNKVGLQSDVLSGG